MSSIAKPNTLDNVERTCTRCGIKFMFTGHKSKSFACARCVRNIVFTRAYGISYDEVLDLQGGELCALCRKPETATYKGRPSRLSGDHNHETGELRGLLCRGCNVLLGRIENMDPVWFERAMRYIADNGALAWGSDG